jgi:hypothetical protein
MNKQGAKKTTRTREEGGGGVLFGFVRPLVLVATVHHLNLNYITISMFPENLGFFFSHFFKII